MKPKPVKLIRISTVAFTLDVLLKGQLRFLNKYFKVVAVSGEDKHLQNIKEREGVQIHSVKMKRRISVFKDLISLIKLYLFFRKKKPQIVHSVTPKAGLLSMVAGYFAKVPIRMHTFTGLIFPTEQGLMKKLLIWMDKLLCACATHVYPEGEGVKQDLLAYKITNKPLSVIHNGNINGIDIDFFNPKKFNDKIPIIRKELGISPDDYVFVFVGRLVGDKGINELVTAFEQLLNTDAPKSIKLLLVGPYENQLDPLELKTLEAIESNKNIVATGYMDDVRPFLAISNVFVFPSYREGFPNAVMQAGAMGLPSIVTNINGCNEIIKPDLNGILISSKNSDELFQEMKRILLDQNLYSFLKNNAQSQITERYNHQRVWKAILKEYENNLKFIK